LPKISFFCPVFVIKSPGSGQFGWDWFLLCYQFQITVFLAESLILPSFISCRCLEIQDMPQICIFAENIGFGKIKIADFENHS
jgi:hypothetical protein